MSDIKPLWTFIDKPEYFGYYDSPEQTEPKFDPWNTAPCPICGMAWTMDNVRTISFVEVDKKDPLKVKSEICYFYRVHMSCHNSLSPEDQAEFENRMNGSTIAN